MNGINYNTAIQNAIQNAIININDTEKIDNYDISIPILSNFEYNSIRGGFAMGNMENPNIITRSFKILCDKKTNRTLVLKSDIIFDIKIDEYGFYYSSDRYNIHTFGETQEDVENNLLGEFLVQYKAYALEDDDKLDEKALMLKKNLLTICDPGIPLEMINEENNLHYYFTGEELDEAAKELEYMERYPERYKHYSNINELFEALNSED